MDWKHNRTLYYVIISGKIHISVSMPLVWCTISEGDTVDDQMDHHIVSRLL